MTSRPEGVRLLRPGDVGANSTFGGYCWRRSEEEETIEAEDGFVFDVVVGLPSGREPCEVRGLFPRASADMPLSPPSRRRRSSYSVFAPYPYPYPSQGAVHMHTTTM